MQRKLMQPRDNWQAKVETAGLTFHSPEDLAAEGAVYWDESACYTFSAREIDTLEAAANELQTMCLAAAQHVIDQKRFADLTIPEAAIPLIEQTWKAEPPVLYGRFDLMYDGLSLGCLPCAFDQAYQSPRRGCLGRLRCGSGLQAAHLRRTIA